MMPANRPTPPSTGSDLLVAQVLDKFTDEMNAGRQPDVEAWLARHAELAATLRPLMEALQCVYDMSRSVEAPVPVSRIAETNDDERRLGDFRVEREIGRGGMGVVYEAEQISIGRTVALKMLPFAAVLDEKAITRFKNEARAAGTLHHPNIVPVHAVGHERGVYYYAMALIDGLTLAEVIRELHARVLSGNTVDGGGLRPEAVAAGRVQGVQGCLAKGTLPGDATVDCPVLFDGSQPPIQAAETARAFRAALSTRRSAFDRGYFAQVARIGIQAGEALHHAHEHGIVHRDIKPGNLLLDAAGKLWVTDFGLARIATDPGMTMTGDLVGTLRYMAPEQALANRIVVDHRADIYSLGVTLYELLTFQPAFDGASREVLIKQLTFDEPTPPRKINPRVPADLATIVTKAMSKSPDERYASAQRMVEDLRAFLDERPIAARPPTLLQRAGKWSARNRPLVASTAVILVLLTIGLAISNLLIGQERNQKSQALEDLTRALAGEQEALGRAQRSKDVAERNAAEAYRQQLAAEAAGQREAGERQRAEAEAELASAVKTFLQEDVLRLADPATQHGEGELFKYDADVPLRDVVLRAAERIEGMFLDRPLVEADIRHTLGFALLGMGRPDLAARQCERVVAIRSDQLGPDHPDTLASMLNLAQSYHGLGRHSDVVKLNEQTLGRATVTLGAGHPIALSTMMNLANGYDSLGQQADALKLREQTLELATATLGPDHAHTLKSMINLAQSYAALARYADALKLHEQALELTTVKLGPDHPDTLKNMGNVAASYAAVGRNADALKLHEQVLELTTAKLGPDHPDTLTMMEDLSVSYQGLGRYTEALKLCEQSLERKTATLGPDHPQTLLSMHNLASSYDALGRQADALKLREQVLELRTAALGVNHPDTLASMSNLAISYNSLGRYADAVPLFEQALERMTDQLGPDHLHTLATMNNLATGYVVLGRQADAVKLREQTLERMMVSLGPDHPHTLATMINLANSYAALGRQADALQLREQGLELMTGTFGPDHPHTLATMINLASSYAALGRHADALKLREQTLELMTAQLGQDHPNTLRSMINLAMSYFDLGRDVDALKLHEQTLELTTAKLGPDHPDTLLSMTQTARTYLSLGRHADALKLNERVLELLTAQLGPDHPERLASMHRLAYNYGALGRYADALKLHERALETQDASAIQVDELLVGRRNQAIHAFRMSGKHEAVLPFLREEFDFWQKLASTHADQAGCHAQLFHVQVRLADWLKSTENDLEAGTHFNEARQSFDRIVDDKVRRHFMISTYLIGNRCHLPELNERASDAERGLRDRIAATLESALAEIRPDTADDLESRLDAWNAISMAYYRERNWQGVEEEVRLASKLTAHADNSPNQLVEMVPLLLLAGKYGEYREVCEQLMTEWDRWTSSRACGPAYRMLFFLFISGKERPADPDRLLRLMQQAAERGPAWLGAKQEVALVLSSESWHTATIDRLGGVNDLRDPLEFCELAMAYAHDGQPDAARDCLEKGDRLLEETGEYLTYTGDMRLEWEIRRQVALRLIQARAPHSAE